MSFLPTFLDRWGSGEIHLWSRKIAEGLYDTDVPKEAFAAAMDRASKHAGYAMSHARIRSYHSHDAVLEVPEAQSGVPGGPGGPGGGGERERERCVRRTAIATSEMPGAPLLAVVYDKIPCTFPCGIEALQDVRAVERVTLRVHRRARLHFEVYKSRGAPGKSVRRVYLTVDPDTSRTDDSDDLKRTVENTVHVVLLGMPPLRSLQRR